jgi:hypothetical protein
VKIQPQWAVTPGKQTNKQTYNLGVFNEIVDVIKVISEIQRLP